MIGLLNVIAFSQSPQVSETPKTPAIIRQSFEKGIYYGYQGDFSIEIPTSFYNPYEFPISTYTSRGLGRGMSYTWFSNDASYLLQFINVQHVTDKTSSELIGNIAKNIVANEIAKQGELVSEKDFSQAQIRGKELKIKFPKQIVKYRLFFIEKRLFVLKTEIKNSAKEAEISKFFDSFQQIEGKGLMSQKIVGAEPTALPQTPIVEKTKSDAEDLGLKGKVKSVKQSFEYDDKTKQTYEGKLDEFEILFNEKGNFTRKTAFSIPTGKTTSITVYGYLNGKRVSNVKSVRYQNYEESDKDNFTEYQYFYDEKGYLKEYAEGNIKSIFNYAPNLREETKFYNGDKIIEPITTKYDENGNEIEQSNKSFFTTFTYESFDVKGNWTKRIQNQEFYSNSSTNKIQMISYRHIIYYD